MSLDKFIDSKRQEWVDRYLRALATPPDQRPESPRQIVMQVIEAGGVPLDLRIEETRHSAAFLKAKLEAYFRDHPYRGKPARETITTLDCFPVNQCPR